MLFFLGFQEKTAVSESSFPIEEPDNLIEKLQKHAVDVEESLPQTSEPLESLGMLPPNPEANVWHL